MSVGPEPKRLRLSETELNDLSKEELLGRWAELEKYLDHLETKASSDGQKENSELVSLRESEEKLKQQQSEATRRENVLVMRLTTKEQEMQEYAGQIQQLKRSQVPGASQLRSSLLDPAVNLMFERMKKGLDTTKAKLEDTQNDLSAWKFTPDSNTGKRLMAKCRLLHQENEELGKIISSGRVAKLEGDLALHRNFSEEMKKSQADLDEFLMELDEDVEGMQSTIYYLQQQLRESKEAVTKLQQENLQLKSPVSIENDITPTTAILPEKVVAIKRDVDLHVSSSAAIALVEQDSMKIDRSDNVASADIKQSESAGHQIVSAEQEQEEATTTNVSLDKDDVEMSDVLEERTTRVTVGSVSPRPASVLAEDEREIKMFAAATTPPILIIEANSSPDLETNDSPSPKSPVEADEREQRTQTPSPSSQPPFIRVRTRPTGGQENDNDGHHHHHHHRRRRRLRRESSSSSSTSSSDEEEAAIDASKSVEAAEVSVVESRTKVADAQDEEQQQVGKKRQEEEKFAPEEQTTEATVREATTPVNNGGGSTSFLATAAPLSPSESNESGTEDLLIDCRSTENGHLDDEDMEDERNNKDESADEVAVLNANASSRTQSPRTPPGTPPQPRRPSSKDNKELHVDSRTHSDEDFDDSSDEDSLDVERRPNCWNSKKATLNGLADTLSVTTTMTTIGGDESDSTL